jgi:hypothetical protein
VLIVAIPKSASSSLVASLCEATGYPRTNAEVRKNFLTAAPPPIEYCQLKRFHSEVGELSNKAVAALIKPRQIVKLHIVPTDNNLTRLREIPKIVLLRPAEEVVAAYWRGMETATWTTSVKEIARCKSLEQWMQTAMDIGLTAELEAFNQHWKASPGNSLVISYQQLTTDSDATIASVLEYFNLDTGKVPELGRVNYSRDGGAGTHFHRRLYFSLKRLWARVAGT